MQDDNIEPDTTFEFQPLNSDRDPSPPPRAIKLVFFLSGVFTGCLVAAIVFSFLLPLDKPKTSAPKPKKNSGKSSIVSKKEPFSKPILNGWFHEDSNSDGKPDEWALYENDVLTKLHLDENFDEKKDTWSEYQEGLIKKSTTDMNFDGKPDEWTHFSRLGRITRVETDMNFDGKIDAWENFDNSQFRSGEYDVDYDGKPDEWTFGVHGQITEKHVSLSKSGKIDQKVYYKNGIKKYDEFDVDGDGKFEKIRYFDNFGQVIETKSSTDRQNR